MESSNYTVYMHINKINDKKYIGITCKKTVVRWGTIGNGYSRKQYLGRAIDKYGWNNFEHKILHQNLTGIEAKRIEKELIEAWGTTDSKVGYNLTKGGEGICGFKMKESTIKKIADSKRGKKIGEKHRISLRNSNIGRIKSKEEIEKIRTANLGKKLTKETKDKMGKNFMKTVLQIDKNTNAIINTFDSLTIAQEMTGADHGHISKCCYGKRKTAGGYKWKFYEGSEDLSLKSVCFR